MASKIWTKSHFWASTLFEGEQQGVPQPIMPCGEGGFIIVRKRPSGVLSAAFLTNRWL